MRQTACARRFLPAMIGGGTWEGAHARHEAAGVRQLCSAALQRGLTQRARKPIHRARSPSWYPRRPVAPGIHSGAADRDLGGAARNFGPRPANWSRCSGAMLANATRICDAKFGNLLLYERGEFRVAAMHGAPPTWAEFRNREPVVPPRPRSSAAPRR